MYHRLHFRESRELDMQIPGRPRLEQVKVRKGDVIEAFVRPYVQETDAGPVEMADLALGDDGTLLAVPMEWFRFV